MNRAQAILDAVVEVQTDDEGGAVVIHRDIPGDHDPIARDCWCCPHVFTFERGDPVPDILSLLRQVEAAERPQ